MLRIENLTTETADSEPALLQDLSLCLDTTAPHGLLGPSGSGKTLLGLALRGLVPLARGTVQAGVERAARVAVVPAHAPPEAMDARTLASLLGTQVPEELRPAAARPLAELSRGERQRVVFKLLLSADAELLVVDDPEVSSVAEVQAWREVCASSSALGRALLLMSRHEVALAALCPTLHILFDGRVIASGATEALVPAALHLARKRFG